MNKTNFIVVTLILILSGCSNPNEDASVDELAAHSQPQIDQEDKTVEAVTSEKATPVSSLDASLDTADASEQAIQNSNYNAETLRVETILLIKTLHTAFNSNIEEQQYINQKLQQATSRADDDAVMQMSIDMFTSQRSQLQSLPLTEDKLLSIRDKIVKALNIKIEVNQKSISIRNPKPEEEQKFINAIQESNRLSAEANNDLNRLIQEQGITF